MAAEDHLLQGGDQLLEAVPDAAGPAEPITQPTGGSRSVPATVTYTWAEARAAVLMSVRRSLVAVMAAGIVLALLLAVLDVAAGDSPVQTLVPLGFFGFMGLIFLVFMPWQIVKTHADPRSWVVGERGVQITFPGTDVKHEWSRFDEVVIRPSLVQFRIGRCSLVLPRRCVDEQGLAAVEALAVAGGASVRRGGRFR